MRVMIHACQQRMWYVDGFLVPELQRQHAEVIEVWLDSKREGNLKACMDSFQTREGPGATWHIQDDVLLCRDFVERCNKIDRLYPDTVAYGFCCEQFTDDPQQVGCLSVEDAWHSFQCVRIPDDYAKGCAEWLAHGAQGHIELPLWLRSGKMDDSVFRNYLLCQHSRENVLNVAPNLVEHVDYIIGGSVLHQWRGYLARSDHWDDAELIQELKKNVKGKVQYVDQMP